MTLKNGQSRKESFSALEKLTRNEALKEHFIISDGFLMIDGVSVAMGDIAAISLKEKEAFDFFNLPEESLSSAIYDLPEESPTLQDKVVKQAAPVVSGSDVASFDLEQMKAMRLELDLTQKVLGERTGIPQKRISSIERLLVTPTSEELKKIQKELDISFVENSNEKYFAEPDLIQQAALPDSDGSISAVEKENAYVYDFDEVDNASVGQKRKAKKEKQIPEAKRSFSKIARVGVWVLVLGLGASGGMAFGAAATANVRSAQAQSAVESVQNQLSNPEEIVDDTTQVDAYFSRFLPIFLNSNPQDNAAKTVREETLKEYFGDPSVVSSSSSYIQKLTSYKLYEISQEDTQRVAKYLVTYSIEDTEEDSTELVVNQLINIPFISENGVIAISEIPYYTSAPQDKGLTGLQENSMNDESEVPSDESSEVATFLEQFFANYATNSLEDMSYMMADPESLDGEYEYVSSDNRVYAGQDGGYIVKSVVEFTLKDTTFNHKENMTITLSKVDGKFFVSELNHTLGGN